MSQVARISTGLWTPRAALYAGAVAVTALYGLFVWLYPGAVPVDRALSGAVVLFLSLAGAEAYLLTRRFREQVAALEATRRQEMAAAAARALRQQQVRNQIFSALLERLDLGRLPEPVLRALADAFEADAVAVWLADPGAAGEFRCRGAWGLKQHRLDEWMSVPWAFPFWLAAPAPPPVAWVTGDGAPEGALAAAARKEEWLAGVLMPCLRRGDCLGVLGVFYRRPRALTDAEQEELQTLALWLAAAAQTETLYRDLVRMQKIESVGTLASGIAHDFNNILAAILACASYCKQYADPASQVFRYLEATEESAQRGAALTRQLLSFVRREEPQVRVVNVNEHIEQTLKMLERSLDKSILVQKQLAPQLPAVEVDPSMLEQVILNIAVNARDAMPNGGFFIVSSRAVTLDRRQPRRPAVELPDGDYVVLGFRDTGHGMDEATRQRIFEPFFTTKGRGKGTGLGLSLILSIVHNFGGDVRVESEVGVGTLFEVYLPASSKPLPATAPATTTVARGGGECILIAEDEDIIREMAQLTLEAKGYKVIAAADGAAAVARYREAWQKVDLVIADMAMPRLSGPEVLEAMKKINPHVRVIVSSGYSHDQEGQRMLQHGCLGFLQKPYNPEQLCQAVRSVLDAGL